MKNLISPIAIDLGTKNTGVVHLSYEVINNKLEINSSKGELIQIDIKNKIWSQADRRNTRHRIRNYKRRKLAKRLLIVILENHFKITIKDLNFREKDTLFGLLKRRGYTFFESETNPNEEILNQIKLPERVKKIEFAKDLDNYLDLLIKIKKDPKEIKELDEKSITNLILIEEDKEKVDNNLSKSEVKIEQKRIDKQFNEKNKEVKILTEIIEEIRSPSGAKPRKDYIDDITKEIEKEANSKYKHLDKVLSKINKEHLTNLICNISNLQLRVLRKYFNYIREDTKGVSNYKYFVPKNFNLKAQEERKPDLDIWDEAKLARIYYKWVKSWHPDKNIEKEIENFRSLLKMLKNVKGCNNEKNSKAKETFINFLTSCDPKKTIPPYEDMNNRNIGGSPVLYLNEEYLNKNFKEWNEWLKNLYENYEDNLEIKINEIYEEDRDKYKIDYKLLDANIKNNEINFENFDTSKKLIIFARMLDRSAKFDPYKFRLINSIVNSDEVTQNKYIKNVTKKEVLEKAIRTLKRVLKTESNYNRFILFLKYYFEAIEISKQGLWDKDSFPILERKNLKLKTKGKLTEILLQAILGVDMISEVVNEESEKFKNFKDFFNTAKIGNTTLKGYCEGASKLIDNANISEDNRLNIYYNYLRGRYGEVEDIKKIKNETWYKELKVEVEKIKSIEKESKNKTKKEDKEIKNNKDTEKEKESKIKKDRDKEKKNELENINTEIENLKLFKNVENFANLIGKHFNQTEDEIKRYSNIYSLAQIFNILVKDRKGFSKIAKTELIENNWRSSMIRLITGQSFANANRLINDSVRLIDGFLKRVLGDQVNTIVKGKILQLEEINFFERIKSDPNINLILPIIFEENKFSFQEDLTVLKDSKAKSFSNIKSNFQDKNERIKFASKYICAYTGIDLNNSKGEIDHIFSRSSSKASQEVYNHEANLIYVSRDGNETKDNKDYKISDLNVTYLKNIFGESNLDSIETKIKERFNIIKKRAGGKAENIKFHSLNLEDQKIVRHAGFVSELKEDFKRIIQQRTTTQVNGVQAFLSKQIVKKIRKALAEKGVKTNENTIKIFSINSKEVSFARKNLASIDNLYKKSDFQTPYSHILDALLTIPTFLDKGFAKNIKILELDEKINEAQNFEFGLIDGNFLNNFVKEFLPKELTITKLKSKESYEKSDISSKSIFEETIYGERFKTIFYSNTKDGKDELNYGYTFKESLPFKSKIKKTKKEYLPEEIYSILKDFFDTDKRISRSNRENKNKITKKLFIKETLAECKEYLTENKKYIWFQINKTKAFNFFYQYNKKKLNEDPISEIEQIQFELLNELHFLTKKVKLLDKEKKNNKDDKDDKNENTDSKNQINPNSPFFKVWDKFSKATNNFTDTDKKQKIEEFFKISENRKRGKIRNTYSLPIVPTGLGTTVRINRGDGDSKIWQFNNINKKSTKAYQGFSKDTKSGVYLKDLLFSNNIVFNTDKTEKIVGKNKYENGFIPFNKWVKINEITNPNVLECEISYYSEGECISKLKYKLEFFIKEFLSNQKVNSYFQIPKNIIQKELSDLKNININEKLILKADKGKGIEVVKISQEDIVFLFKFKKSSDALDLYLNGFE